MRNTYCSYKSVLLAILFWGQMSTVLAQKIFVKPFPLFYELPTNEVFDVHQDSEGFIWLGTTNGVVRYDGQHLMVIRSDYSNPLRLTSNVISVIVDSERLVWIGTRKGLNLYDKHTGITWAFPDNRLRTKNINALSYSSADKTVWVGDNGGGIYQCTEQGKVLKHFERLSARTRNINDLYADSHGRLWAIADDGIYMYDASKGDFINYGGVSNDAPPIFFTMLEDSNGNYWVGSWGNGVYLFRPNQTADRRYERKSLVNLRTGEQDGICFSMAQDGNNGHLWLLSYNSLYEVEVGTNGSWHQIDNRKERYAHKMYTRIIADREGDLWLSSYDMAYTLFFNHSWVNNFSLPQIKSKWGWDTNLLNLTVTNDSTVWMTQDRYGLCIYDLKNDVFLSDRQTITDVAGAVDLIRRSVRRSGVWVCNASQRRLQRLERRGSQVIVSERITLPDDMKPATISNFFEDRNGMMWILADGAVYRKAPEVAVCQRMRGLRKVSMLFTDDKDNVYAMTESGTWSGLTQSSKHIVSIPQGVELISVCMDRKSRLWALTSDGRILRQERNQHDLLSVGLERELEGCAMLGILPTGDNVWIVANKKIIQYDTKHERQLIYEAGSGEIMVDLFRYKAFCADGKSGLYAGGHNGFLHITPRKIGAERQTIDILPLVTDVAIDGKSIYLANDSSNSFNNIILPADCRNVSICFSLLRYAPYQHARIAWRLVGVDKDWTWLSTDNNYQAFYNALPKGTHKFQIKIEVSPGVFSEPYDCLTIYHRPAPYETWWAILFYILLGAASVCAIISLILYRIRKFNERRLAEEVAQTKMDYFTNVSHELLTPLSVISCIAETLNAPQADTSKISILRSNINRLHRLIQQVLDFRRTDTARLSLRVSHGDIGSFVKKTCETNFALLAKQKNISLNVAIPATPIEGNVDFEKLDKILYNLLSNALKYTEQGGKIDVACCFIDDMNVSGRPAVQIKVSDNGIGIEEKEQKKIFSRYYSSRYSNIESNGIGLSLTRSFVELHGGVISVESTLHKGSTFTVVLPIDNQLDSGAKKEEFSSNILEGTAPVKGDNNSATSSVTGKTVLLVDDNVDLLSLTSNYLSPAFNVLKATNLKEAWDLLSSNESINLVITDVMFPDGNGLEFCKRVRHDVRFNHIPIIILTAKATEHDRVQSYQSGADGYVAKPFSLEVLSERVKNLLWLEETRKARFRQSTKIDFKELGCSQKEQELIEKITAAIENHLSETDFDLNRLAETVSLSKSTLHRRIKTITGMTPGEFIHNVKMKKACDLIKSKGQTIAEVAYSLGFSDPKYFTKCFKDEFGITPTKYKQDGGQSGA